LLLGTVPLSPQPLSPLSICPFCQVHLTPPPPLLTIPCPCPPSPPRLASRAVPCSLLLRGGISAVPWDDWRSR
jgi:hypothetical protein